MTQATWGLPFAFPPIKCSEYPSIQLGLHVIRLSPNNLGGPEKDRFWHDCLYLHQAMPDGFTVFGEAVSSGKMNFVSFKEPEQATVWLPCFVHIEWYHHSREDLSDFLIKRSRHLAKLFRCKPRKLHRPPPR